MTTSNETRNISNNVKEMIKPLIQDSNTEYSTHTKLFTHWMKTLGKPNHLTNDSKPIIM